MYPGRFMCSQQCHSNYLDSTPPSDKTRGLKSRYHDGYRYLSWRGMPDGTVTQGSLWLSLTTMARVRVRLVFYFFPKFLQLEFYLFRNYDPKPGFSRIFDTLFSFLIKSRINTEKPINGLERTHRELRVSIYSPMESLHVKLEILWQAYILLQRIYDINYIRRITS